MSDLTPARMIAIKDAMAAQFPARVVTRDLVNPNDMPAGDLAAGVYTLLSRGESDYTNVAGYEAQDGKQDIILFGDFKLSETVKPSEIEDLEFTMLNEVQAFCRALPAVLCQLSLIEFIQSGQIYHPYGWIVCRMRYLP